MKVAILTLIGNTNYGNLLQAYALQKIIQGMGHSVTIINRREGYPSFHLLCFRILSVIKTLIRKFIIRDKNAVIQNPFSYNYRTNKNEVEYYSHLVEFGSQFLNLSKPIRTSIGLRVYSIINDFDVYVVGSDQVWREAYVSNIDDYFLDFIPKKKNVRKIAYAASFGTLVSPISNDKLCRCRENANTFNAISVRESFSVQYMNDVFHIMPKHVLDPTFLLSVDDYIDLIGFGNVNKAFYKDTVVSYILDSSNEIECFISELVEQMQFSHVSLLNKHSSKLYSIQEWLSFIYNASFMITDSFHGCVFSIIFNKPFVVIANQQRGLDRVESLLDIFHQKSRLIKSLDDLDNNKDLLFIKPQGVNFHDILEHMRTESIVFLNNGIGRNGM